MNNLYEVTNGMQGFSYSRVYAWAPTVEDALKMAEAKFKPGRKLEATLLFLGTSAPFCSEVSDEGFEMPN